MLDIALSTEMDFLTLEPTKHGAMCESVPANPLGQIGQAPSGLQLAVWASSFLTCGPHLRVLDCLSPWRWASRGLCVVITIDE